MFIFDTTKFPDTTVWTAAYTNCIYFLDSASDFFLVYMCKQIYNSFLSFYKISVSEWHWLKCIPCKYFSPMGRKVASTVYSLNIYIPASPIESLIWQNWTKLFLLLLQKNPQLNIDWTCLVTTVSKRPENQNGRMKWLCLEQQHSTLQHFTVNPKYRKYPLCYKYKHVRILAFEYINNCCCR